jgi:murein DD-endopeptidase MepM/ murein hydrolase activator NlpD
MLNRGNARRRQTARILGEPFTWDDEQTNEPAYAEDEQRAWYQEALAEDQHDEEQQPPAGFPDEATPLSRSGFLLQEEERGGAAWSDAGDYSQSGEHGRGKEPNGRDKRNLPSTQRGYGPPVRSSLGKAVARLSGEPTDPTLWRGAETAHPVVVPGRRVSKRPGALGHTPFVPRSNRHRSLFMHLAVVGIVSIMLMGTAFAIAPLGTENQFINGIKSLAGFGAPPNANKATYFNYVVHDGDSLKSIADKFGVLPGGILLMNGLHSADDLYTGLLLKIPTDPTYGASYQAQLDIPIPPPDKAGNVFGTNPWNSQSGATDPNNICAPAGNADTSADRQLFQLINPNPNARYARGFTWYHNGVDLDNPSGTPILAAQAGLVVFAGWDNLGLGNSVKINNCNGLSTIYGHMRDVPLVHAGDYVQVGQQVGVEGSTGNSTGPHLHFMTEWWNKAANPYCFDFALPSGDTPCTTP